MLLAVAAFLLATGLAALLGLHYRQYLKSPSRGNRIPGPPQLPGLGNLYQILPRSQNVADLFLEWTHKYGRVWKATQIQFAHPIVFVSDPAVLKHVLVTGFQDGRYGKGQDFLDQYDELFGRGIFASNGKEWFNHREFAKSMFVPDKLRETCAVFEKYAHQLASHLESRGLVNVDMLDYWLRYTLNSFGEAGFGAQLHAIEQDVNRFAVAFDIVQTKSAERAHFGTLWKYFPRNKEFDSSIAYINDYCKSVIDERKGLPVEVLSQRKDLLSRILVSNHPDGRSFTNMEIADFLKNFLIAGRDTTAVLLTWCVYMLSQHPDVEAKVLEEMAVVLGDKPLTMENVSQLRYLKAVLQETLRLYPPVPIDLLMVLADDGDTLPGDFWVGKDTAILYSAYVLHRMPEFWPDPLRFDPERFLGEPPRPYTYLPFHGGPRLCLGMDMAYLEARIALVVMLRKFKFVPHPGFVPTLKGKIILTTSNGMMMDLVPRA